MYYTHFFFLLFTVSNFYAYLTYPHGRRGREIGKVLTAAFKSTEMHACLVAKPVLHFEGTVHFLNQEFQKYRPRTAKLPPASAASHLLFPKKKKRFSSIPSMQLFSEYFSSIIIIRHFF